jgi:hypothetical protein
VLVFAAAPMLAQLQRRLPIGEAWRYEPKLDGFRGLLWRRGDTDQLLSRNLKDLTPWFPELADAGQVLPPNTLVDAEIILVDGRDASDFGALQRRPVVARRDLPGAALLEVAAEDRYRAGRYWGAMPCAFCSESIHSWPLSSLVVRADLTAPPAAKASATAAAEVSPGAS